MLANDDDQTMESRSHSHWQHWVAPTPPCKSSKMDSVIQLLPFQPRPSTDSKRMSSKLPRFHAGSILCSDKLTVMAAVSMPRNLLTHFMRLTQEACAIKYQRPLSEPSSRADFNKTGLQWRLRKLQQIWNTHHFSDAPPARTKKHNSSWPFLTLTDHQPFPTINDH